MTERQPGERVKMNRQRADPAALAGALGTPSS